MIWMFFPENLDKIDKVSAEIAFISMGKIQHLAF